NYFFHDSTACLVVDGKLVVALEEERFSRNKHTTAFPATAIRKCLEVGGLDYSDIDHVAVSIKPTKDWPKKLVYGIRNVTRAKPFLKHELWRSYNRQQAL